MTLDDIRRALSPLSVRISNLVGRGVIKRVDDAKKVQELQVDLLDGETRDEVESFGQYGLTSSPPVGAEAVAIFVGGRRDHALVIGVEDRRYRVKNLPTGEVCLYSQHGQTIVLKTNGDVEITPKAGQKLKIATDVEVTGTLTASVDVVGGGKHLATHTHSVPAGSVTSAPGAVTYVPGPETGAPS